jgi:hypothetical protein
MTDGVTAEMWWQIPTPGGGFQSASMDMYALGPNGLYEVNVRVELDTPTTLRLYFYIGVENYQTGVWYYPATISTPWTATDLTHVAFVGRPDGATLYVGGAAVFSVTHSADAYTPDLTWNNGTFVIGAVNAPGTGTVLDEARLSRTARYSGPTATPTLPFALD